MKIIFFSDVHGNKYSFESFLEQIKEDGADKIIFGGDALGYYYYADEIINYLRRSDIVCLLGNHDKMFLDVIDHVIDENELVKKYGDSYRDIVSKISRENVDFLRGLDTRLELEINGLKLGFFHGGPADDLLQRIYPDTILDVEEFKDYDYVFLGHTHHKLVKNIGGCTILNPGSLGQQRDGKGCSYVEFDTEKCEFEIKTVEYDIALLEQDICHIERNKKMRERLIEVLYRKPHY